MAEPRISSVRHHTAGAHDYVNVWVDGQHVGSLVVGKGQGEWLAALLESEGRMKDLGQRVERAEALLAEAAPALREGAQFIRGNVERLRAESAVSRDAPWLVKDFHVLYRAAHVVVANFTELMPQLRRGSPLEDLHRQLGRLRPAFEMICTVQEAARAGIVPPTANGDRCPTCDSPSPKHHPAVQWEGEVQLCSDAWHGRTEKAGEGD